MQMSELGRHRNGVHIANEALGSLVQKTSSIEYHLSEDPVVDQFLRTLANAESRICKPGFYMPQLSGKENSTWWGYKMSAARLGMVNVLLFDKAEIGTYPLESNDVALLANVSTSREGFQGIQIFEASLNSGSRESNIIKDPVDGRLLQYVTASVKKVTPVPYEILDEEHPHEPRQVVDNSSQVRYKLQVEAVYQPSSTGPERRTYVMNLWNSLEGRNTSSDMFPQNLPENHALRLLDYMNSFLPAPSNPYRNQQQASSRRVGPNT